MSFLSVTQLHGTCLGFETLAVIASKNHSILSEFDAENLPSPLFPTDKAEKRCGSCLLGACSGALAPTG